MRRKWVLFAVALAVSGLALGAALGVRHALARGGSLTFPDQVDLGKVEQGKALADGTYEKTERYGQLLAQVAERALKDAKPVRLTLGVPQLLTVTWNRKAARPAGCAGSLPAGFTGTLRAVALSHGQSSPVRTFKIAK